MQCPRCKKEVEDLKTLSSEFVQRWQANGEPNPPGQICVGCKGELQKVLFENTETVISGHEKAREHKMMQMWANRVHFVRTARQLMARKAYSEAAVSYEKYLKVLEIVFGLKKGQRLDPQAFKDSARTSELTVVASVYWDLLRIYDSSDQFSDRQEISAKQLAQFLRFTPIFPDIIKKAEVFQKQAKHPQHIKTFLRDAAQQRPRCFIATSAFASENAFEVQYLRWWRDQFLVNYKFGNLFLISYYFASPKIAEQLDRFYFLKPMVRFFLRNLIRVIDFTVSPRSIWMRDEKT